MKKGTVYESGSGYNRVCCNVSPVSPALLADSLSADAICHQ